ncbi:hypothetical protein WA158_005383 [Blastocystis sp. Blastoise]
MPTIIKENRGNMSIDISIYSGVYCDCIYASIRRIRRDQKEGCQSTYIHNISINRHILKGGYYIGQFDKCFLLFIRQNHIFCIDQHAAHERIRLEQLTKQILAHPEAVESRYISQSNSPINNQYIMTLTPVQYSTLYRYENEMRHWGFQFKNSSRNSSYDNSCVIQITHVPYIFSHAINVTEFIPLLNEFHNTCQRNTNDIPEPIHRFLAQRSCRGAIKFNTPLSPIQSLSIYNDLYTCIVPFHCAHGRPTTQYIYTLNQYF